VGRRHRHRPRHGPYVVFEYDPQQLLLLNINGTGTAFTFNLDTGVAAAFAEPAQVLGGGWRGPNTFFALNAEGAIPGNRVQHQYVYAPDVPVAPTPLDEQYARQMKDLLPRGAAWLLAVGSSVSKVLLGIAQELVRIDGRGRDLVNEADPRTATETLAEWERALGLPDSCIISIPATTAERRVAITQKFIKRGGQTPAYFVALALACGYVATVYDTYGSTVLRSGFLCGSPCVGIDWAFAFRLDVQPPAGPALSHPELECIIRRVAPAHTIVIFNYL
jgi:uncharacterized protein YmfQ (DUF2313 family)